MYKYGDMKDKTINGITKEVSKGLGKAAFYFRETLGMDEIVFEQLVANMTNEERVLFYMNFRNDNLELFNKPEGE